MASNQELNQQIQAIAAALDKILDIELIYYQPVKDKYATYQKIHGNLKTKYQELELIYAGRTTFLGQVSWLFYEDGLEQRLDDLDEKTSKILDDMFEKKRKYGSKAPKVLVSTSIVEVFYQTDRPNRMPVAKFMVEELEISKKRSTRKREEEEEGDNESLGEELGIIYEKPEEEYEL